MKHFIPALATLLVCVITVYAEEPKQTEAATVYSALSKQTKPANMKEEQWHQAIARELQQFAKKYPGQPEAAEARRNRLQHLQDAARFDSAAKPAFIVASDEVWKDTQADPDERANARLLQLNLEYRDAVPARELLDLWKEFPGSDTVSAAMSVAVTETVERTCAKKCCWRCVTLPESARTGEISRTRFSPAKSDR